MHTFMRTEILIICIYFNSSLYFYADAVVRCRNNTDCIHVYLSVSFIKALVASVISVLN